MVFSLDLWIYSDSMRKLVPKLKQKRHRTERSWNPPPPPPLRPASPVNHLRPKPLFEHEQGKLREESLKIVTRPVHRQAT